ncbi:hypothetical protein ACFSC4_09865 [Deinococcus malanensis]|uniref:hypothetical protein n=1 Tax=Deinococcus malanensis TaxID=1706855 RepID=UPI00363DF6F6
MGHGTDGTGGNARGHGPDGVRRSDHARLEFVRYGDCMATRDPRWLHALFPENAHRSLPWGEVGARVTLYRPVGLAELHLLAQSDWQAFPPRLPDQPIFYLVLNFVYAEEIARDWNARTAPWAGFVTRFDVQAEVATRYEIQVVGSEQTHQELWVPAEELDAFNDAILGNIAVVASYVGPHFEGTIDAATHLPHDLMARPDQP